MKYHLLNMLAYGEHQIRLAIYVLDKYEILDSQKLFTLNRTVKFHKLIPDEWTLYMYYDISKHNKSWEDLRSNLTKVTDRKHKTETILPKNILKIMYTECRAGQNIFLKRISLYRSENNIIL